MTCAESSLGIILFTNTDLVISHPQVKLGKDFFPIQLLIQIIDAGERIFVFDGLLIDATIVLDQSASTILLLHKQSWGTPRRSVCTDETSYLQLRQLLLELNQLLRTHLVWISRNRLCTRL